MYRVRIIESLFSSQRPTDPISMPLSPASGFIHYCARLYSRDGMKRVCLTLQDRHSLNVNILLAAVWAAENGYAFTPVRVKDLSGAIATIHQHAVQPIRQIRRTIQSNASLDLGLRAGLKRMLLYAELRAEHAVETVLFQTIIGWPASPGASIRDNVLACTPEQSEELLQFIALVSEPME